MASKRATLCENSQAELLAETRADGSNRRKGEECPYCTFLIGAHSKGGAPAAGVDMLAELKALKEQGQATLKALEAKKRREIVLSDIGSDGWHEMLVANGFSVDATTAWPDALSARLLEEPAAAAAAGEDPPAFAWTDQNEPDQKDRYLAHLRTYLKLEQRQTEAALLSLDNDKSFLSVSDRRLQFDIKGTTDVAVVHQGYISAREEAQGILCVIELKKSCDKKATRQTIGQLIAADLVSRFTPLAVLTDLRDEWHFYWLEGRSIRHLRPPAGAQGRRVAFSFLRLALAPGFVVGDQLALANAAVDSLPVSVGKRRKLSPVKEERPRRDSGPEDDEGEREDTRGGQSDSEGDEDDRRLLLFRQVRQMIRHTPWLQEVCQPRLLGPVMSAEARSMFA